MTCPGCGFAGRFIRAFRPRPAKTKVLICPDCLIEVKKWEPRKRVEVYAGAVD